MDVELKIVTTALELFYHNGFHATGVEKIRLVAGVSKKTLYKYFPSKDELINAALKQRHVFFMNKMHVFIQKYAAIERPKAYLDFILAWSQEPTFNGCMFMNAIAEYAKSTSKPFQIAHAHKLAILSALETYCREAPVKHAKALAANFFVIGEGVIVNNKLGITNFLPADFDAMYNKPA